MGGAGYLGVSAGWKLLQPEPIWEMEMRVTQHQVQLNYPNREGPGGHPPKHRASPPKSGSLATRCCLREWLDFLGGTELDTHVTECNFCPGGWDIKAFPIPAHPVFPWDLPWDPGVCAGWEPRRLWAPILLLGEGGGDMRPHIGEKTEVCFSSGFT